MQVNGSHLEGIKMCKKRSVQYSIPVVHSPQQSSPVILDNHHWPHMFTSHSISHWKLVTHFSRHATAFEAQQVCTASWQAQKQHIPFIHKPGMLSLAHSLVQFSLVFKICLPPQTYIMWLPSCRSVLCVTHIEQPDWNTNIVAHGTRTELEIILQNIRSCPPCPALTLTLPVR